MISQMIIHNSHISGKLKGCRWYWHSRNEYNYRYNYHLGLSPQLAVNDRQIIGKITH